MKTLFLTLIAVLFLPQTSFSLPELVRHGYTNCTTCHHSPNGGGIFTQYGRALTAEVQSTYNSEGESDFAYGLVKTPKWLEMGGNFRSIVTRQEYPNESLTKFIRMQADLETALVFNKLKIIGTVGLQDTDYPSDPTQGAFFSRRHYLLYSANPNLTLRAGKFMHTFGVMQPDHMVPTRQGLGWNIGSETYNLEASWINEEWNLFATGVFGRPDQSTLNRETGFSLNASRKLSDTYKAGLNYFHGSENNDSRHVIGMHVLAGFTPKLYLLKETNFEQKDSQWNLYNFTKLGYEPTQGLHFNLFLGAVASDLSSDTPIYYIYGPAIQYFPRPHIDLQLTYEMIHERNSSFVKKWLTLMMHFYL